jgi:hypothetical protein
LAYTTPLNIRLETRVRGYSCKTRNATIDTTILFFLISELSAAIKCRRSCQIRKASSSVLNPRAWDKSINHGPERDLRSRKKVASDYHPYLWVSDNVECLILVRLSCNFLMKIAKGDCDPASTLDLRTLNVASSHSGSWRRMMETEVYQLSEGFTYSQDEFAPFASVINVHPTPFFCRSTLRRSGISFTPESAGLIVKINEYRLRRAVPGMLL